MGVHRMDIYVPGGPVQGGSKPVIMFVHGGVWASGDKWQFSPLGSQLAQDGVIAVVVQYTLFPQVRDISMTCRSIVIQQYGQLCANALKEALIVRF
jgi:acetyl esterase/lipase